MPPKEIPRNPIDIARTNLEPLNLGAAGEGLYKDLVRPETREVAEAWLRYKRGKGHPPTDILQDRTARAPYYLRDINPNRDHILIDYGARWNFIQDDLDAASHEVITGDPEDTHMVGYYQAMSLLSSITFVSVLEASYPDYKQKNPLLEFVSQQLQPIAAQATTVKDWDEFIQISRHFTESDLPAHIARTAREWFNRNYYGEGTDFGLKAAADLLTSMAILKDPEKFIQAARKTFREVFNLDLDHPEVPPTPARSEIVVKPKKLPTHEPMTPEALPTEIKRFTPEARAELERRGYEIYEVQSKTLEQIRREIGFSPDFAVNSPNFNRSAEGGTPGDRLWNRLDRMRSTATEVAIPRSRSARVLPFVNLSHREIRRLGKRNPWVGGETIPGTKTRIGNPIDGIELIREYGKRHNGESLINGYTAVTSTPSICLRVLDKEGVNPLEIRLLFEGHIPPGNINNESPNKEASRVLVEIVPE